MALPSWLPGGWFPGQSLPIVPGSATQDIVSLIARRCRRNAPDGSPFLVEIISEIVHAQLKLEEGPTLPWFLKKTEFVSAIENLAEIAFDTTGYAVIRLQDDLPLAYVHPDCDEPIEVHQEAELKILHQKHPGTAEYPKEFYVENASAIVRPIPTLAQTYQLRFYHHDTLPVLGSATLWTANFPDLIMNMAGYEVAWSLRDTAAADRFMKDLDASRTKFVRAVTAREEAGQTHIMGDD